MSSVKWLPLESNPEVMNKCLNNLGVPENWGVSDVVSFDEELIPMVPVPSLALLLLFPVSAKYTEQVESHEGKEEIDSIYFMKQTIRNACGTIALIHAIANNVDKIDLKPDSVMKKFLDSTRDLCPEERGLLLEQNLDISAVHESSAQQGQTEAPDLDDEVNLHFICLINANGKLVELDGRRFGPVVHGPTSEETFLKDAFRVCGEFMERDPGNVNFTALSFGAL